MALDGLGEKLKSLFKSKDDPRFKGQGRRLGTAETYSSNPKPHQLPHAFDGAPGASTPGVVDSGAAPTEVHTQLKPPPQPQGPGSRPALALSRSHRTEEVVLDAAVMANTPTGKEAHLVAAHKPPGGIPSHLVPGSSPASLPASPPHKTSPGGTARGSGGGGISDESSPAVLKVDVERNSGGGRGGLGSGGGHLHGAAGRGRPQPRTPTSNMSSVVSTISTPTAAEKRMGGFRCPAPPTDGAMADYGLAPATSQAYELQRCLALVLSCQPLSNSNLSSMSSTSAMAAVMLAGASAPTLSVQPQASTSMASSPVAAEAPGRFAVTPRAPGTEGGATAPDATAHPSLNPLGSSSLSSSSLTHATTSEEVAARVRSTAAEVAWAAEVTTSGMSGAAPPAQATGSGTGAIGASVDPGRGGSAGSSATAPPVVAGPWECCDALLRVLRNVMTRPDDPKFRQIRLTNPRVQETIVGVPGAVEFLEAAGFQMRFCPDDGSETANQGYLFLPEGVPPTAMAEPFRILSSVMAAHGFATAPATLTAGTIPTTHTTTTTSSPGHPPNTHAAQVKQRSNMAVPPGGQSTSPSAGATSAALGVAIVPTIERHTQVLLPAAPDVEVPDWFFERTGAEVRDQWAAMVRKREEQERFMTRTMREVRRQQEAAAAATAAGAAGDVITPANVATVRVRFPEGVCLQGRFGAAEPVSRVFEWVSASLRAPYITFKLITPDRRPLDTGRNTFATASKSASSPSSAARSGVLTIGASDMLPSILLNLLPTGPDAAALAANNVPLLSDELLQTTKPQ